MTPLSPRGLLAVAAVIDIAVHARAAPVSARTLAERHGSMPRHFESLLQDLVRAGLLKGHRGPRGGYELARERRRISAGEIVRAVEGTGGDGRKPRPRPRLVTDVVEPALDHATAAFLAALDAITIDHLCRRAEAREGGAGEGGDFAI